MSYNSNYHSVFDINYHIIFCIKYRREVINDEISNRLKEIFEKSQESLKNGRFGNKTVGFIDFPRGWKMFVDADSGKTTMQITRDGFDIYTLDIIYLNNKNINILYKV